MIDQTTPSVSPISTASIKEPVIVKKKQFEEIYENNYPRLVKCLSMNMLKTKAHSTTILETELVGGMEYDTGSF